MESATEQATAETAERPPLLVSTVERIGELRTSGPWLELRALFADDARLESLATGGIYGPDETVEAMSVASQDGVYSMGPWELEELDEDTVLLHSRMRHLAKARGRGVTDAGYVWLFTGQDGLIRRLRIFSNRAAALSHLEEHGPSLGL